MAQVSQEGQRVVIISADCHAGPQQVSDYEPYTPEVHKDALRDYLFCIDAFEAERTVASGAGGRGGAVSRDAIECYGFDTVRLGQRAVKIGPAVEEITRNPLPAPPDEPGVELSWAFRSSPWA